MCVWGGSNKHCLLTHFSLQLSSCDTVLEPHEKTCLLGFDQVRLKPVCSATVTICRLESLDIETRYYTI